MSIQLALCCYFSSFSSLLFKALW
uniref:Uncharacterized protein n=1 Tax=Arundo donax TaxID=35708 RepID=A0A0A9FE68_ARUDO